MGFISGVCAHGRCADQCWVFSLLTGLVEVCLAAAGLSPRHFS